MNEMKWKSKLNQSSLPPPRRPSRARHAVRHTHTLVLLLSRRGARGASSRSSRCDASNFTNSILARGNKPRSFRKRRIHTLDTKPLCNTHSTPIIIVRHMKSLTTLILPIHAAHAVAAARQHTTTRSRASDAAHAPSERTASKKTFRSSSLNAPTRPGGPCRRDARRRRNEKASQRRLLLLLKTMPMSKTMRFRRRETERCG